MPPRAFPSRARDEAMANYARNWRQPGRGGYREAMEVAGWSTSAAAALRMINGERTESIVFTSNCTDAINLAVKGLVTRGGGHAICTHTDHTRSPSDQRMASWADSADARRHRSATGRVDPMKFAKPFAPIPRHAITHGSNVTGAVQPIARSAKSRARRRAFVLMAAQTIGHCRSKSRRIASTCWRHRAQVAGRRERASFICDSG